MEKRFVLFLVLSFAILMGYQYLMVVLHPAPDPEAPVARREDPAQEKGARKAVAKPDLKRGEKPAAKPSEEKPTAKEPVEKPSEAPKEKPKPKAKEQPAPKEAKPPEAGPKVAPAAPEPPQQWVTLGSADPGSPYRMLVTLTNRGAAVALVELNSPRYCDLDDATGTKYDRTGYLGRIVLDKDIQGAGCPVQVVGPGTPAEEAGLLPDDLIKAIDGQRITGAAGLHGALQRTKPGQTIELTVSRAGQELAEPLRATLRQRPLAVIRPEADDPRSFLMTLSQIDADKLVAVEEVGEETEKVLLDAELKDVRLRNANWEVAASSPTSVTFVRTLPKWNLEVSKTYRLAQVPAGQEDNPDYPAYDLVFEVKVRNLDGKAHQVAYQLDGPNGLPIEGWWYSTKVSRSWGSVGVRDVTVMYEGDGDPTLVSCQAIAGNEVEGLPWIKEEPLRFIGVDAQYFSAVLIPQREAAGEIWFAESRPMTVGPVDEERKRLANTSFRATSTVHELQPEEALSQQFLIFAGPKRPSLLENGGQYPTNYGLGGLVYYGWFSVVAEPLLGILHLFYAVVHNYGLAIIMLTVLVRLCMFPLSRKQTLNALKMQELQPEIKKIQEKYKKDLEGRTKAQQELFRKHNYNPLGGCLVMFIQLPIFVALYRALMVDVELRQAPLFSDAIRWCSNLAAPDMFFDWSGFMPEFVTRGIGLFGLGPYFNILPIATVALFLGQQKMLMPPPADDQARMQQNIMKYMMIFMGVLFFKVASGLCVYFIASSLWGLGERRFLPKREDQEEITQPREKPKPKSKPKPKPAPTRSGANGDGAPTRKKKKRKRSRGK